MVHGLREVSIVSSVECVVSPGFMLTRFTWHTPSEVSALASVLAYVVEIPHTFVMQ